ncbi:aldose 1-epimerase [Gordoniibacillus kamchatkensis]|nr:aldose 1-epimerase [Paenibacillus sp. VKM B-2647]
MRYEAYEEARDGYSTVVLADRATDSSVAVVLDIGCNIIGCRLQGHEVIASPPHIRDLAGRSSEFGVPLLWPPSRIPGGTFAFQGRTYTFPLNEGRNHLHGEIRYLPWEVTALAADEQEGASVTAEFRFDRFDEVFAYYPHRVVLRLTVRLCGNRLSGLLEAVNEGDDEAPAGFGLHPYFSYRGDIEQVVLAASVARQYDTGENGLIVREPEHTALCDRLAHGMPLNELPGDVDHFVFAMNEDRRECTIIRRNEGVRLRFEFSRSLPYLAVFKPSWADAVSLEPWSCITDAFNAPLPSEATGAAGLKPGQRREYGWTWSLDNLHD